MEVNVAIVENCMNKYGYWDSVIMCGGEILKCSTAYHAEWETAAIVYHLTKKTTSPHPLIYKTRIFLAVCDTSKAISLTLISLFVSEWLCKIQNTTKGYRVEGLCVRFRLFDLVKHLNRSLAKLVCILVLTICSLWRFWSILLCMCAYWRK